MATNTKIKIAEDRSTTANKGFSAMLAEEYILIVPFANQLQSGLDE